jgi:hypothetical protein
MPDGSLSCRHSSSSYSPPRGFTPSPLGLIPIPTSEICLVSSHIEPLRLGTPQPYTASRTPLTIPPVQRPRTAPRRGQAPPPPQGVHRPGPRGAEQEEGEWHERGVRGDTTRKRGVGGVVGVGVVLEGRGRDLAKGRRGRGQAGRGVWAGREG